MNGSIIEGNDLTSNVYDLFLTWGLLITENIMQLAHQILQYHSLFVWPPWNPGHIQGKPTSTSNQQTLTMDLSRQYLWWPSVLNCGHHGTSLGKPTIAPLTTWRWWRHPQHIVVGWKISNSPTLQLHQLRVNRQYRLPPILTSQLTRSVFLWHVR